MPNDPHLLASLEQVRAIIGPENPAIRSKFYPALEESSSEYIRHSPLLLLSTVDREGHPDVSPKGDGPGFVAIEDERTLLIPERKGNKLIQGLQNILATGRVALVFLVPGTEETLRVHGRAELTADPAVLARLTERGQPALLAIRVHVEQVFFHCAKAFKRSKLWQPESWPAKLRISFGTMFAKRLGAGADVAEKIDQAIEEDYRSSL
jgi:PPOX class probable FMN-dependent enzyme